MLPSFVESRHRHSSPMNQPCSGLLTLYGNSGLVEVKVGLNFRRALTWFESVVEYG